MTAGVTRRQILASGGSAALAAALLGPAAVARAATTPRLPAFRRSSYTALADLRFTARLPWWSESTALTLAEVADLPRAATLKRYRGAEYAFSLTFEGPPGLEQNSYRVTHPATRPVDMFLTPIGPAGATQRYEAVIDRLYAPTKRHPAPRREHSA